jgi:hypothetical protein
MYYFRRYRLLRSHIHINLNITYTTTAINIFLINYSFYFAKGEI